MTKTHYKNLRYWGWGTLERKFDPEKRERLFKALEDKCGLYRNDEKQTPLSLADHKLSPSRLPKEFIQSWSKKGLSLEVDDRVIHSVGKSYRDLIRIRSGHSMHYPDGVLHLQNVSHLKKLYQESEKFHINLIPFGGGTGVVGGTECIGKNNNPVLIINLKKLNKLIHFDEMSQVATFQAGILGPELEKKLNAKGFTLGHFPQSFEFSTLGGWVATRSAGQNSTKYGKIEKMVQSLTLCSPKGEIITHAVPASATGPSIKDVLIGSEGIYGIITEVTVKVKPLPEKRKFVAAFFKDFSEAMHAIREIMQSGLVPSVIRLHDEKETELFNSLSLKNQVYQKIFQLWSQWKRLGNHPCFALLAVEGLAEEVHFQSEKIKKILKKHQGKLFQKSFEKKWHKERFELPYVRDDLLDYGYFIDTLETATPWSKIEKIYLEMHKAFQKKLKKEKLFIGTHLSHAYSDGASLYFTFIGKQRHGDEIKQWEEIKTLATDVIVTHGGALSHHHGIGYDHKRWMSKEQSPLGLEILREIKKDLDPETLLNPGKVF